MKPHLNAWSGFKELLMKCPQHYLTEMQEVVLFYNGLDVPTRQIINSRGITLQNLFCSSFPLKIDFYGLGDSISVMPLLTYLNLGLGELAHTKLTVELAVRTMKYLKGIAKNVLVGYPSDCDHDKKIRIDCAYNLKFSCMIDFAVLEDMDAYRDEGMGNVIFGQPFLREVRINAKWFEGMITIHNGNEEVTYQMGRSHSRFKHHTNEQCNKIPPLLKDPNMSEMRRWKNGSHAGTLACMRWNEKKLKKSLT
ncbi:hypothetical protein Tco_0909991 [Tanacetum coccineum]|uniref:Uncharacterized protein n=1 Tax=Tanacetum coccineum TaxID=301880 RepID=A0ABQ5CV00_9ASTR